MIPESMNPAVRIENLHKAYGSVVAVEDVSFAVPAGEIFGVVGPNGAGKTTTIECAEGLRRADRGRVSVLASIRSAMNARFANASEFSCNRRR